MIKGKVKQDLTMDSILEKVSEYDIYKYYFGDFTLNEITCNHLRGVPYFLPRKWVKMNEEDCKKALEKDLERSKKGGWNFTEKRDWTYYKNHQKPVLLKVGFSYCNLGWKTKWSDTDFRHEWNPTFSFVFFGYQIALRVIPEHDCHYWECWLYYELKTDKSVDKKTRIEQAKHEFPQIWTSYSKDKKETVCYYWDLILKKKYL